MEISKENNILLGLLSTQINYIHIFIKNKLSEWSDLPETCLAGLRTIGAGAGGIQTWCDT